MENENDIIEEFKKKLFFALDAEIKKIKGEMKMKKEEKERWKNQLVADVTDALITIIEQNLDADDLQSTEGRYAICNLIRTLRADNENKRNEYFRKYYHGLQLAKQIKNHKEENDLFEANEK